MTNFKFKITTDKNQRELVAAGDLIQSYCHGLAREAGWHTDINTGNDIVRNDGELICLMHSELSEAMEAVRKDLMDDHLPHRKGVECELADTVIRIFDYAGLKGLNISSAITEKLVYNSLRADHKLENRKASGGKKF